jgi:parallel beta-helix repeat protein
VAALRLPFAPSITGLAARACVISGNPAMAKFEQLSMNSFTVYRENLIESNGGILITGDSADILVEGNTIRNSDLQICVRNSTRNVVTRNNDARIDCFSVE